jgi:hypothetical protein
MAYDTVAQGHDSAATITSPAEVAIWINMSTDSIEYTVPNGKMFRGWLLPHSTSTSPDYTYTPGTTSTTANSQMGNNGALFSGTMYHTSTGHDAKWPINMNAGDKIKRRSSHPWTLMGLETTVNTVSWDTSS